jgi:type IV pilus assembly protein PilM
MALLKRSIIGIELDSKEIRAVEVRGSSRNPEIFTWGRIDLPEGIVKDGRIVDQQGLSMYLAKLISQSRFKSREVILGINNQDVIIRFASFPKVPDDKVRNMIMFQAQEFIPVPLDDLQLDYVIVGERQNDEGAFINVILVGARKKMLHDFIEAFANAKLVVKEIDSSVMAVGRSALSAADKKVFAVVGFNNDIANIMIFNNGIMSMARSVSFSQSSVWTNKRGNGINGDSRTSTTIADILIGELRSSIGYYRMQSENAIEDIYLIGKSGMREISEKFREAEYAVTVLQPYAGISAKNSSDPLHQFKASDYTVAISLGLRGLEE